MSAADHTDRQEGNFWPSTFLDIRLLEKRDDRAQLHSGPECTTNSGHSIGRSVAKIFPPPKKQRNGKKDVERGWPPFRLEIEYHNSATTKGKDSSRAKQHMAICWSRQQANPYKSNASVVIESIGQHHRLPQMAPSLAIQVVGEHSFHFLKK